MRPLSRLAALSVLLLNSCYPAGDGKAPPLEELYFPTGLAIDGLSQSDDEPGAHKYLYVANSDFDLQYRASSVISYNLDSLRKFVPRNCNTSADCAGDPRGRTACDSLDEGIATGSTLGPSYYCVDPNDPKPCGAATDERDQADLVLNPGRCKSIDPNKLGLVVDAVGIGAFATDVLWRANPDPDSMYPARLFIPVRGDSTLHWIDLKKEDASSADASPPKPGPNGTFECGQNNGDEDGCDSQHRSGGAADASDNPDHLTQPAEPYALDATADGAFVAITNQTSGSVSLFANDWRANGGPKLVSVLTGLPLAPVGIAAVPDPPIASGLLPGPGFLVAYRTVAQIDLLRVHCDAPAGGYTRSTLRRAGSVPINANSLGFDSRGIVIDDTCSARFAECSSAALMVPSEVEKCVAARVACVKAMNGPPGVYVASRAPASLLVGAMTTAVGYPGDINPLPSFTDSISLTFGASRVILGDVKVRGTASSPRDGAGPYELERRIFAVCFDSRRIFIYDPKRRVIDAIVSTGRGPYALAVDGARALAYLGHFTDSYLGVVSLDQRFPQTYATIVASIGAPKAPRTSK